MLTPKLDELVTALERTNRIIWFAMCMAIFIYGAVVVMTTLDPEQAGEPGDISAMLPIMAGMGALTAVGALMFKGHAFSDHVLRAALSVPPGEESALPGFNGLSVEDQRVYAVVGSRQTMTIIILAMQEAIAIYGLALAFIARDAVVFAPFGAVAFLMHLMEFPRTKLLAERVQKLAMTTVVTG